MSSIAADLGRPRGVDPSPPLDPTTFSASFQAPTVAAAAPWRARLARLLPLLASLAVTLGAAPLAYVLVQHAGEMSRYGVLGYPALFLIQTLMSATLFLPAPGAAVVVGAGTFLDPSWVGVAAGLGSATGELSGYLLGFYGRRAVPVDRSRLWRLAERELRRGGIVALFLLAIVPNPCFDALGILAGCMRYPISRFWLATAAGKVVKFFLFAYGGWLLGVWLSLPA